jgi:transcriptional regulator with XRE-family HTH domain
MALEDFPANLRFACSFERSVSDVCRQIGLNRQQFNKYLNGTSRPSAYNLQRICRHFDLEAAQFYLAHQDFAEQFARRSSRARRPSVFGGPLAGVLDRAVPHNQRELKKYLGFYYSCFYSLGWQSHIMRSLVHIYEYEGRVYSKAIERILDPSRGERFLFKYEGIVSYRGNRIFIIEYESLTNGAIANTILYPTYRSHVTLLSGLSTGVSSHTARDPAAVRVVYEFLGRAVDYRVALRNCGLFAPDSRAIDPRIRAMIDNTIVEGETVFRAQQV